MDGNTTPVSDARAAHDDDQPRFEIGDRVAVKREGFLWQREVWARAVNAAGLHSYQLTGRDCRWHYENELRPWQPAPVDGVQPMPGQLDIFGAEAPA